MKFVITGMDQEAFWRVYHASSWRDVRRVLRRKGPFLKTIIRRSNDRWTRQRPK